jgi:pyruvate kinase
MVTLGTETSQDYALVRAMLLSGMNCARINCAHDDPGVWAAMIANIERARRDLGLACPVLMDLGGPKLRTGQIEPGPAVLKWRPKRDAFGRVFAPARIFLSAVPETPCPRGADVILQVDSGWLNALSSGDLIDFVDARGARRALRICESVDGGCWAEATKTAYVTPDTVLRRPRRSPHDAPNETRAGCLPKKPQDLVLRPGDMLVLTRDATPGRDALTDAHGRTVCPASIPCTLPQVFEQVRPGERIALDDGRIRGVIRHVSHEKIHIEINGAREAGSKLGPDKGINLPDSTLDLPALTDKDLQDLSFVVSHADMVGLSFVQRSTDIEKLQQELKRLDRTEIGIVLKIETRRAFENLPDLMLAAMRSEKVGVMIARGDLAVELGYERMAEVQEEIMWLTEAAHLPVIWATQVLESLAKHGQPSRAEITDAAMSEQAECVMLNKGPHVVQAIEALDDILSRMRAHHHKKRAMMRQLHW